MQKITQGQCFDGSAVAEYDLLLIVKSHTYPMGIEPTMSPSTPFYIVGGSAIWENTAKYLT